MKRHPLATYLLKISSLAMVLSFVVLFLMLVVPKEFLSVNIPYYIMMFYIVTFASYVFLFYSEDKIKISFNQAFIITKGLKFLIYITVFAIVLLFHIEKNTKFAIAYLIIYFAYTVFDVITTQKLAKNKK
ncbi:MAG: hypothetical protein IJ213_08995 [Bacteroidales bacterium]|nr:hypothetical protein [Bacteroidales bacterium]